MNGTIPRLPIEVDTETRPGPPGDGEQHIVRFPNGYGASIVRHAGSYGHDAGLYELGVITHDGRKGGEYQLTYNTPITDDVLGYLTVEDVAKVLLEIRRLPPA